MVLEKRLFFWLSPRSDWALPFSGLFCSVGWSTIDVSGSLSVPSSRVQMSRMSGTWRMGLICCPYTSLTKQPTWRNNWKWQRPLNLSALCLPGAHARTHTHKCTRARIIQISLKNMNPLLTFYKIITKYLYAFGMPYLPVRCFERLAISASSSE
jgi:hypothetical protein